MLSFYSTMFLCTVLMQLTTSIFKVFTKFKNSFYYNKIWEVLPECYYVKLYLTRRLFAVYCKQNTFKEHRCKHFVAF